MFFITLAVFVLVILMMSIGVLLGRSRIEGSCGGPDGCDLCLLKGSAECKHRSPGPPCPAHNQKPCPSSESR